MKLRQRPRWIYLLGLGMLSACATHKQQSPQPAAPVATSVPQTWSFETEWTRAAAGSAPGSAGHAWERSVNPTVERAYAAVLSDCATQRSSGDPGATSNQRVVLDIALSGGVRQVWSETDSPLLTCARASLDRMQFPPPPRDGYRLGMLLDLGIPDLSLQFPRIRRPAPGSMSSYEAMQLAITNMVAQEGQGYLPGFSSAFLAVFRSHLGKCMAVPLLETERSLRGYRLIIEIAGDGTTKHVLLEPNPETSASEPFQSPRADCLRDGSSRAQFPAPPRDGSWVFVDLDNPLPGLPTENGSDVPDAR